MLWGITGVALLESVAFEVLFTALWLRLLLLVSHLVILGLAVRLIRRSASSFGHEVTADELVVRGLLRGEVRVPLAAVTDLTSTTTAVLGKPRIVEGWLQLPITSTTNVQVTLAEPREVAFSRWAQGPVVGLRLWADDPAGLVRALEVTRF